jgi:hypothetical protein
MDKNKYIPPYAFFDYIHHFEITQNPARFENMTKKPRLFLKSDWLPADVGTAFTEQILHSYTEFLLIFPLNSLKDLFYQSFRIICLNCCKPNPAKWLYSTFQAPSETIDDTNFNIIFIILPKALYGFISLSEFNVSLTKLSHSHSLFPFLIKI